MADGFKYTTTTLKKLEEILELSGYVLRYEKGNFHSGYCLLDNKQVVVVNKFFDMEGRINSLIDIIGELHVDPSVLPENLRSLLDRISLQNAAH
jgi:hypothetical protein